MVLKGKCMIYVARLQKLFIKKLICDIDKEILQSEVFNALTLLHLYEFSQNNSILESNIYTSFS